MDRFIATYLVEFPRPANPDSLPLYNFELTLDHLLTEHFLELRATGDNTGGITLVGVSGISMREAGPGKREYVMAHDIRFETSTPAQARVAPAERFRAFLADALGLTPRQWEGPYNIVGLTVTAA